MHLSNVLFKKLAVSQRIDDKEYVKVTQMGHIIEMISIARKPDTLQNYVKLSKEAYAVVDRHTGEVTEIKEYAINENRSQNISGLKKTLKNIKDLINSNFSGAPNELFITLTYALIDGLPMNDVKKASRDFDVFIKRFRRKHPDLQYIAVLEPQASSSWHWHLLVKFIDWQNHNQVYINNNETIEPMWGHGWTRTQRIDNVDNVGAYLGAYLGDIEITDNNKDEVFSSVYKNSCDICVEEKEVTDNDGKRVIKRFVKGGRMHLYPSGTNIVRYSKGIKKPEPRMMRYSEARKIVGDREPDFSRTIEISENKDGTLGRRYNTITYESYNLKRKKNENGGV